MNRRCNWIRMTGEVLVVEDPEIGRGVRAGCLR